MSSGHVFVLHGDLRCIAADAVLIPCDCTFDINDHWGRFAAHAAECVRREDLRWDAHYDRVSTAHDVDHQLCRFVNTGATEDSPDAGWLGSGVAQGLAALVEDVVSRTSLNERSRPLIAMPLFGTGEGGFHAVRGEALTAVLGAARQAVASVAADVAIVCWSRADYTALQSRRKDVDWAELTDTECAEVSRLADAAAGGELALFIGAGVSRAAGLPDFLGSSPAWRVSVAASSRT